MKRAYFVCFFLCMTTTFLVSQSNPVRPGSQTAKFGPRTSSSQAGPKAQAKLLASYGTLPLSFEANQGQLDERVKFVTRAGSYTLFLTRDEAVLAFSGKKSNPNNARIGAAAFTLSHGMATPNVRGVLEMKLRNANLAAKVTGADELAGKSNYFIGNDPRKWRTVTNYAKVKYERIYPGIDLVYYGNQQQLEYDFIVAPRADSHRIAFDIAGAKQIRRDKDGDLVLDLGEDEIRWHKPLVYQEKNGTRREIAARYTITDTNQVGFELAKYDANQPLYIDPLIYSTYLGGSSFDSGRAIAVDGAGNAYVTGKTYSMDFPIVSGAFQKTLSGDDDVFVTKFNPGGSALIYSTYLGGSGSADGGGDIAAGIQVDGSGNAYLTGTTFSSDFPTTAGAFQTVCGGSGNCNVGDGFVTKLNSTGSALVYSSYLGGSSYNNAEAITVDSAGSAYVTGGTESTDFPITPGAFQTTSGGGAKAFLTKFNPTGSGLVYSTYLGGSGGPIGGDHGYGVAVDSAGSAYVTGATDSRDFPVTPGAFQSSCDGGGFGCSANAFITKFNTTGSGLVYSSYLGGTDIDWGMAVAVDSLGNAYVAGTTYSKDFPTTSGGFQTTCGGGGNNFSNCWDAFVTKMNPDGSALVYSNYLGGTNDDWGIGITVDGSGYAYVIGYTQSTDFPTKLPLQPTILGELSAFVTKIDPTGSALAYSTYLGGIGEFASDYEGIFYMVEPFVGIAVDKSGNAYVTGRTDSYSFPTMTPLQPFRIGVGDAFVAKISAAPSDITLFPLHLDFRDQPTGVASNPQVSMLNNTGNTSLAITSINITGTNSEDFAQTNNCGASLQPGTSCSITVTFNPTNIGSRSAAVKIVDSAPRQWISLTGLGLLDTVTTLTSNVNPSALGKPVTFRTTVSSPSGGTPTGLVYVTGLGPPFVVVRLNAGKGMVTTTKLPLGLDVVTASYTGDTAYGFSASAPVNQYVRAGSSTTTLTSSPNPSAYQQKVNLAALVASSLGPPPPDGEMVTFMNSSRVLGTGVLHGGSASLSTSALSVGKSFLTAVYGGDSSLVGSKSQAVSQVVNKATTVTTLASSQNPSTLGQSVTLTATVTPQFSGVVTGAVTFYDGTTILKTAFLNGGVAKFTTKGLTSGTHSITATYNGNASFSVSSASLTQIVN
jgi:hypothetical protein